MVVGEAARADRFLLNNYEKETNPLLIEKYTQEEVGNAYYNAILYSDYFLSKTINFLKTYSKDYKTAIIYISDQGESLGEKMVYIYMVCHILWHQMNKNILLHLCGLGRVI